MKPAELRPLVGRTVEVYWHGYRTGTVKGVPSSDVLSVQLLGPHGRRKIPIDQVRSVYWYGKANTVTDYLKKVSDEEQS